MSLWARAISAYVGGLVHPSVRTDPLASARHRAFIAAHLVMGAVALAGLPAYLVLRGGLTPAEALVFALLAFSPVLGLILSRTARLDVAQLGSAALLCLLVVTIALRTGGTASFALVWALLIPAEASLSGSRRLVAQTSALTAASVALVCLADALGWVPASQGLAASPLFHAAGVMVAVLYAGSLAAINPELERLGADRSRSGEARYAMLAENMNDLVVKFAPRGAVAYASPAAPAVVGAEAEELIGQGLFDRVHVQDRPAYLSALSQAQAGRTIVGVEVRLRRGERQDPRYIWAEIRCRPLQSEGEVVAVIRDVSERKGHELEMEAARAEAERANAAKGAFLATMSHELRTPLNAVIGFSEMLINREALRLDPARQSEYAALIHSSGHHLLGVVNGILDMSKIETGNFALVTDAFEVPELLESCRQMMRLKAEEGGVALSVEPGLSASAALPDVVGDQRACRQIVLNLLSNALKFTPQGGRVTLSARESRGGVMLQVRDTGIGIAGEDLPRLGEAFFQASSTYARPYEGTGLGLSIVKGLAALHGGYLEVASEVGRGTTMTVHLPLNADCETSRAALAWRQPRTAELTRLVPPARPAPIPQHPIHWEEKRRA